MKKDTNKVTLRGKIGNDVKMSKTTNDTPVCNIRLCVEETFEDRKSGEKRTSETWITCVGWNFVAQEMNKFGKDQYVQVEGKISNRMRVHEVEGVEPFQYPVTEVKVATIFPID